MFRNYLDPIEKMNKYILIVNNKELFNNKELVLDFHESILGSLKDGLGVWYVEGEHKYFTICFTHKYNLQRLYDILNGVFSQHKKNSYKILQIKTMGFAGFDTRETLDWFKDFDNIQ